MGQYPAANRLDIPIRCAESFECSHVAGCRPLSRKTTLHLMHDVAGVIHDLEPLVVPAGFDRLLFRPGIGKHDVVLGPVVRNTVQL